MLLRKRAISPQAARKKKRKKENKTNCTRENQDKKQVNRRNNDDTASFFAPPNALHRRANVNVWVGVDGGRNKRRNASSLSSAKRLKQRRKTEIDTKKRENRGRE